MKIEVNGANTHVTERTLLTSGAVGLTCEFAFDKAWDGLMKTAVFRAGSVTRDVVDIHTVTTVPHEVLETAGQRLQIGVYGTNESGDLVIPTVWADMGLILNGADPSGDPGTEPTLPVWAQVKTDTVQTVPQSLTGEQQKQVRENIGAMAQPAENEEIDCKFAILSHLGNIGLTNTAEQAEKWREIYADFYIDEEGDETLRFAMVDTDGSVRLRSADGINDNDVATVGQALVKTQDGSDTVVNCKGAMLNEIGELALRDLKSENDIQLMHNGYSGNFPRLWIYDRDTDGNVIIEGVAQPIEEWHAANKLYVDNCDELVMDSVKAVQKDVDNRISEVETTTQQAVEAIAQIAEEVEPACHIKYTQSTMGGGNNGYYSIYKFAFPGANGYDTGNSGDYSEINVASLNTNALFVGGKLMKQLHKSVHCYLTDNSFTLEQDKAYLITGDDVSLKITHADTGEVLSVDSTTGLMCICGQVGDTNDRLAYGKFLYVQKVLGVSTITSRCQPIYGDDVEATGTVENKYTATVSWKGAADVIEL